MGSRDGRLRVGPTEDARPLEDASRMSKVRGYYAAHRKAHGVEARGATRQATSRCARILIGCLRAPGDKDMPILASARSKDMGETQAPEPGAA